MSQSLTSTYRALSSLRQNCLQLRFISATAIAAGQPATSSATPDSNTPPPSAASNGPLPYRISRSSALNLPVYHRIKSGGTNRTTEVKKIEGDARELSKQLKEELSLETKINPRTNHVIIKGFHKEKVVSWLSERGF